MPGKRYDLQILKGPCKGQRVRCTGISSFADHVRVEMKDQRDTNGNQIVIEVSLDNLKKIPQHSTQPKSRRKR